VKARDETLRQMVATAVGEVASAEAFAAEVAVGENALKANLDIADKALRGGEVAAIETAAAEAAVGENTAGIAAVGETAALEAAELYAAVVREALRGK